MSRFHRSINILLFSALALVCSGCFKVPLNPRYEAPPPRPPQLDEYYNRGRSYLSYHEKLIRKDRRYELLEITIATERGQAVIDYYRRYKKTDDLIFVFPVLGGNKNFIEGHFAEYFARNGFDTAIVNRDNTFKDPEKIDQIEEIFRDTVIRDRIAIDLFEKEYGKKNFGTFGISRGAINVAMTAGVDPRLTVNVLALGGSSVVKLFAKSDERRIRKYREQVQNMKKLTKKEFVAYLSERVKTDPDTVAQYIDARNTLLFLSLFDSTVPITFGRELRKKIGKPTTVYLLADHRTAILYTGIVPILFPNRCFSGVFPIDYIETESLAFFNRKFGHNHISIKQFVFETLQLPFIAVERGIRALF